MARKLETALVPLNNVPLFDWTMSVPALIAPVPLSCRSASNSLMLTMPVADVSEIVPVTFMPLPVVVPPKLMSCTLPPASLMPVTVKRAFALLLNCKSPLAEFTALKLPTALSPLRMSPVTEGD